MSYNALNFCVFMLLVLILYFSWVLHTKNIITQFHFNVPSAWEYDDRLSQWIFPRYLNCASMTFVLNRTYCGAQTDSRLALLSVRWSYTRLEAMAQSPGSPNTSNYREFQSAQLCCIVFLCPGSRVREKLFQSYHTAADQILHLVVRRL